MSIFFLKPVETGTKVKVTHNTIPSKPEGGGGGGGG